jgi:hypothetical protein
VISVNPHAVGAVAVADVQAARGDALEDIAENMVELAKAAAHMLRL